MKNIVDLKSVLCGVIIAAAAFLVMGSATSGNPAGRFQVTEVRNGTGGWAAIMVNTETGEAWGIDFAKSPVQKADKFWQPK